MNLLIDASAIPKQPVGAGVYISRLVRELLLAIHEFDLRIIAHEDDFELFNLQEVYKKNFLFVSDYGRGFRILSEQFTYPKFIKANRIDLYHGLHYSMPLIKKTRIVTTVHDMTFFKVPQTHIWLKKLYFKFFIKYSGNHSDHLISVSDNTKIDLINLFNIKPEKITTTHLGVDEKFRPIDDLDKFQILKNKYHLPDHFVLYVGLIEPRKNLSSLIRSYSNLRMSISLIKDIHLVIAGRWGWESEKLMVLVSELNIAEQVHFPGYIEPEDLPFLYNMAKVFVYPSFYEGFGLPVLESMACGTPVITSNVSSMPEFVGDSGLLIDPNDISGIQNALGDLLMNDQLRIELSGRALKRSKEFTWKETARKTLDVYRRVLKGE
jgi:glycosyltransferase involved in cell wall biosynthesis